MLSAVWDWRVCHLHWMFVAWLSCCRNLEKKYGSTTDKEHRVGAQVDTYIQVNINVVMHCMPYVSVHPFFDNNNNMDKKDSKSDVCVILIGTFDVNRSWRQSCITYRHEMCYNIWKEIHASCILWEYRAEGQSSGCKADLLLSIWCANKECK